VLVPDLHFGSAGRVKPEELAAAFPQPDEDPGGFGARLGVHEGHVLRVAGVKHDPAVADHVVTALDGLDQHFLQPVVAEALKPPGLGGGVFLEAGQPAPEGLRDHAGADAEAPGDLSLAVPFAPEAHDHRVALKGGLALATPG
jgi:hypothetical protein